MLNKHHSVQTLKLSHPYISAPFEMESNNLFINAAGLLRTSLDAERLLKCLLAHEKMMGRTRDGKAGFQDRVIDLDLLLFDELVCSTPDLLLPHPQMHRRLFVLKPLAEVAAKKIHPVQKETIGAIYAKLSVMTGDQVVTQTQWLD